MPDLDLVAPIADRRPNTRTHHGDTVTDEYEWLRDKEDPQVIELLEAENAYTAAKTEHLSALRETLFQETVSRTQLTDLSVPSRRGDWWYFVRTSEGAQHPTFCRLQATGDDWTPPVIEAGVSATGEQILLDCNALAEGQPFFALGAFEVSQDGNALAYSVDLVGNERFTLQIKDLATGELLPDSVSDISYGAVFSTAHDAVYYTVVDDAWRPFQVRRHVVGEPASADQTVFSEDDDRYWVSLGTSTDERFLVISASSKITSEVWVRDLATQDPLQVIAPRRDGVEYDADFVAALDRWLLVHNDGATNFTLALCQPGGPWEPVTLFDEQVRVLSATPVRGAVAFEVRQDGLPTVLVSPISDGSLDQPWSVPGTGPLSNTAIGQVSDQANPYLRISATSFVTPAQVLDIDLTTRESLLRKQTQVPGVDLSRYAERREWATAPDGTKVPISVVYRADLKPDGSNPVLQYGYGSYESSIDPGFSVPRLSLLDRGVVFAVAHIRGGGELGRTWYEQGRLLHKRNTFDDFIACSRFLVESGWAAPDRLAASGGSAGGLLMGAVVNQAPELYAGVLAVVPFVDALTSILDPELPLTVVEWDEWGDPLHDPDAYAYIRSYAPYDNVTAQPYPPILAITSLHDTRVLYVEPAKWVSRLRHTLRQAELPGGQEILLKVEMDGGHAGASGRYEVWKDKAFENAWVLDVLKAAQP